MIARMRWTTEENEKYQSQWNEIIQMLNEAKEELKTISLIQEEKKLMGKN